MLNKISIKYLKNKIILNHTHTQNGVNLNIVIVYGVIWNKYIYFLICDTILIDKFKFRIKIKGIYYKT